MDYRTFISNRATELWLQLGIFVLLLLIKAFSKDSSPHLHFFEIVPTALQLGVALGVNYWLLSRFFYPKKYLPFLLGLVVLLIGGVVLKEIFLEGLFFRNIPNDWLADIVDGIRHFSPSVLLFVGIKLALDARQRQTEVERLKAVVTESELQFLKSQINPHFLFNNLNNLYAHSLNNSPKTSDIILQLSSLMRYMLHDCKEKFVALEKEFHYLRDFIDLQQLQIENKAQIEVKIQGETADKYIAPLILVTFVENSFKHSMSSQTKEIKIKIELTVEDHLLRLYCANTFSNNSNVEQLSHGIGLENVQSRLDLLYPDAHLLNITCKQGLYEVKLEMDLSNVKS
ncbi:MAG: histidine kinase [Saprospiraceae bacterium]|nr:histidine kinase [Saprospiraceae bacterium]